MAGFEISADLYRSLRAQVNDIVTTVEEAQQIIEQHLYDTVQQRAKDNPRWIGVADHIDTWDENDRFWIGVRGPEFASEAFVAEYGSNGYPPAPIFRTLDNDVRTAAAKASVHMASRLGTRYQ